MDDKLKKALSRISQKKEEPRPKVKGKSEEVDEEEEVTEPEEEEETEEDQDEEEETEEDEEEEESEEEPEEKTQKKTSPVPDASKIIQDEIVRLRDNGVYHAEDLYQKIQTNANLERIAKALEDLVVILKGGEDDKGKKSK